MTLTPDERDAGRIFRQAKARERKAAKRERPKSPKADRSRVRDHGYLAWLRRQPCAVGPVGCSGPIEAAHVRLSAPGEPMTGMQRKPSDSRALPLCVAHHREGPDAQHGRGERQWWTARKIDPLKLAATYYVRFQKELCRGSERSEEGKAADAVNGMNPKETLP